MLGFGLLLPERSASRRVGRLWYVPGILLVGAGVLTLAALRNAKAGAVGAVLAVAARNWTAILTGILGLLYLALGLLLAALAPFALATWWSVVTPLLALLATTTATPALTPLPARRRSVRVVGEAADHQQVAAGPQHEWLGFERTGGEEDELAGRGVVPAIEEVAEPSGGTLDPEQLDDREAHARRLPGEARRDGGSRRW